MSISTVEAVARRFIQSREPEVLAIKGEWGTGKTHTWDQIVKDNKLKAGLQYYCYVSLFGISSVSELALAVFTKTQAIKLEGTKPDIRAINEHWASLARLYAKKVWGGLRDKVKVDIPYVKNISVGLEQLAPRLITSTIICFDDFERMSAAIPADELLGFMSYLKEEQKCKVVLIFNHGKLNADNHEIYKKYREKLIDIELLFSPTPSDAIKWGFPTDMPYRDHAEQCALKLSIVNIRLLKKVDRLIRLVSPSLAGMHSKVMEQAVHTLVLVAWAYYEPSEDKPTFEFVRKWERWAGRLDSKGVQDTHPKAREWGAILSSYGLINIDEFDYAISKVIENGFIEESGLTEQAEIIEGQFKANDLEQGFTNAWSLFHDHFSDNEAKLVQELREGVKKSYSQISPMNLNSTVRLLRRLGHNDVANEVIDYYIDKRKAEKGLFDLVNDPFGGEVDDEVIRLRFLDVFTEVQPMPTLSEVVLDIMGKQGWSREQVRVIEQATVDDYYNLFMQQQGENLGGVIRACLQFGTIGGLQQLAEKPRAALERIGRESPLNTLRVRKFGITIDNN